MKCFSRSTLGIIIGILNVVCYVLASVYSIHALTVLSAASRESYNSNQLKDHDVAVFTSILIAVLVVSLIMIIISGLLIMGIIKKRHKLMLPWLIISFIGYVANAIKFVVSLIVLLVSGISFGGFMAVFFTGALIIGIQSIILWQIYTLYKDIRENNNKSNGQTISAPQVNYLGSSLSPQPQTNYYSQFPTKN